MYVYIYIYTRRKFCQQYIWELQQLRALYLLRGRKYLRFRVVIRNSIHVYLYIFIIYIHNYEDERSNALNPSSIYAYLYIIYKERDLGRLAVYTLHIYYIINHIHIHMMASAAVESPQKTLFVAVYFSYLYTRTCKAQTIRTNCPHFFFFFLSEKTGVITPLPLLYF